MVADELLRLGNDHLEVLPRGRLLIRNICMAFDEYLNPEGLQRFSKVI
jgi:oxygen-independent coproporphyrinogen-3 oxidase